MWGVYNEVIRCRESYRVIFPKTQELLEFALHLIWIHGQRLAALLQEMIVQFLLVMENPGLAPMH